MNSIRILIVEDEVIIADDICHSLEQLGYETLEPAMDYEEAISALEEGGPDIAILDINLKGNKDGVDLAHAINQKFQLPFIFLTSNSDMATISRAKQANPSAYLVKPFSAPELYAAVEVAMFNYYAGEEEKAAKNSEVQKDLIVKEAFFIKEKDLYFKVLFTEIAYLKSAHVYVDIHLVDGKKFVMRGSLKELQARLPKEFFRTHRSYIVNLRHLVAINSTYLLLGEEKVPIGRSYRNELLSKVETLQ